MLRIFVQLYCMVIFGLILTGSAQADSSEQIGRIYNVNNRHPQAEDNNPATADKPLKTISAAAKLAQAGDTVMVYSGVYRERVTPQRSGTDKAPITYTVAADNIVYIKGSDEFQPQWKRIGGNIYSGKIDQRMFKGVNPFTRTISISSKDKSVTARPAEGKLEETLGQIFVNGKPYVQLMDMTLLESTPGSWLVDSGGENIYINFKSLEAVPQKQLVEISTRDRIFAPYRRGLRHIIVRGFIMEHCANQGPFPQGGALSIRSGSDWLIENNTIRYAKTVGMDIGSEFWDGAVLAKSTPTDEKDQKLIIAKSNVIRGNSVTDNGLCGITGWNNDHTIIVNNIVERNNFLGYPHKKGWEEWAGIKLHASNALIAGNLVRDNEAHGIWIDNKFNNAHITRNVIVNNLQSGIFLELGAGKPDCLVDNNIIGYTRSQGGFYNGNGIYTHDASDITVAHNLFIANAGFGVCMRVVSGRKFGGKLTGVFNEKILNNVFVGNNSGGISLPADSARSGNNISDYNLFVTGWGGAGKMDFYINKFQAPFDWNELTAKLEAALKAENVTEDKWPNFKAWRGYPVLTIDAWRALTGMDKNSKRSADREGKTTIKLRSRQPELAFVASDNLLSMKCPKVEDAGYDFYGNPLSADRVLPGPFQKVGTQALTLPLKNEISLQMQHVRLTPAQKELKRQEKAVNSALKGVEKGKGGESFTLGANDKKVWFKGGQIEQKPEFNAAISGLKDFDNAVLNARSTVGVSKSPAELLIFRAPVDGWFVYDIASKLVKRTAQTAGYAGLGLYVLDAEMKNTKLLEQAYLNKAGGYKSAEYGDRFSFTGETALKAGWHLVLRLQVISPGPAPAGYASVEVTKFNLQQK